MAIKILLNLLLLVFFLPKMVVISIICNKFALKLSLMCLLLEPKYGFYNRFADRKMNQTI